MEANVVAVICSVKATAPAKLAQGASGTATGPRTVPSGQQLPGVRGGASTRQSE